jgi:phosphoribosylanthranilate isomerase
MNGRTRVKICGLTRREDAELAVELGADALGFVFWPASPRAISPEAVRAILDALPVLPVRVGVFVNQPPDDVARLADDAGLDVLQLHGDERVEHYEHLGRRLIKSVAPADGGAGGVVAVPPGVTALVDAADPERRGGTGRTADWTMAAGLAARRRVILAGGLTPDNVARAVREVRPWAVDVSSGIEVAPGVKSAERMRAFFAAVRGVVEDE